MSDRPPNRWATIAEAAQAVHTSPELIEKWIQEGRVSTCLQPITRARLVLLDDVEDTAEEAAFRLLSQKALAHEDRD